MLIGFKKQFGPEVVLGLCSAEGKRHTIRAKRKDGALPKIGELAYLYTGLRTRAAQKIGEAVISRLGQIQIMESKIVIDYYAGGRSTLAEPEMTKLAMADGFKGIDPLENFMAFFAKEHGLPFEGNIIHWI